MNKKNIKVDCSKGGNGDIWMRLVGFYTVAYLLPDYKFTIKVPIYFKELALLTFSERLDIITNHTNQKEFLHYTHLGIKDLFKPILLGYRFISPYQRAVIHDKKKKELKDLINTIIFRLLNLFEIVLVPDKKWILFYQGYMDIVAIKAIKKIVYSEFIDQLNSDFPFNVNKLRGNTLVSLELAVPSDINNSILVFPTGTGRQFMPIWWALKYLPDAYYAFFIKDNDSREFENAGLKVCFYFEPSDIIYLANKAKWTISTDSFPSHLLQYYNIKTTIVLTGTMKSRIISTTFKGYVIDSVASCHPCLHKARKLHPFCAAGFKECINWESNIYTLEILQSINK